MNELDEDKQTQKRKGKQQKSLPNVYPTNSLILPDGKIFKVQKKRQRKIHSCIPCHQRKIRCSRELPTCFNCSKLADKNIKKKDQILEACKYFDNDKRKNLKKRGLSITPNSDESEMNDSKAVNKNFENLNNDNHIDDNDDHSDIDDVKNDNNDNTYNNHNNININNNNVDDYVKGDNPISQNTNTGFTQDNYIANQNTLEYYEKDYGGELTPNSHQVSDENSKEENDDFVYTPKEYQNERLVDNTGNNNIDTNITSQNDQSDPNSNVSTDYQIYSYYSKQFLSQFIPILENLPAKHRSDELLKIFQTNVHSILPILDMKNFLVKYEEFWYCGLFLPDNIEKMYQYVVYFKDKDPSILPENINTFLYWYNKSTCSLNPTNFAEFLILLYAVYYTSISSSVYQYLSKEYENIHNILSYKNEVNKYYNMFKKMNHKGLNNPRVMSLAVLQINVLIQSITNLKSGKSLINISKVLRICQFYQLNRDPVLFHSLTDKELVQTRRIVWWQIFLLDNLVSFFLNLTPVIKLSDFDTNLLSENLDDNSTSNLSIMYLNCIYRYILIVDDLNGATNGLNFQLKNEDITKMKNNINNLFIICNSSMKKMNSRFFKNSQNSAKDENDYQGSNLGSNKSDYFHKTLPISKNTPNSYNCEESYDFSDYGVISSDLFYFFMNSLSILSDKMLIMLQKKILLNPYLMYDNNKTNSNLNLRLNSFDYSYTDLQNNLLPSLLHYLDTFLLLSQKNTMKFNWLLKNYIPIDELILLMQILATNYQSGISQDDNDKFQDINIKIYLINQTITSLKLNWHLKLSSVNKLISLSSTLWELMILKFNIDIKTSYSMCDKFIIPKPNIESVRFCSHPENTNVSENVVSCAEIAPRSITTASAVNTSLGNSNINRQNGVFLPQMPPSVDINDNNIADTKGNSIDGENIDVNCKELFLELARTVETELLKEGGAGIIQETDDHEEGWFNLGTEEECGFNSVDDFHFFKNLKSDVIRLFKLVVCP